MIFIISIMISSVLFDVLMSSGTDPMQSAGHEEKFKWTPELDEIVKSIYRQTIDMDGSHEQNMKGIWDNVVPQWKRVSAGALRQHAKNIIHKSSENTTRRIQWTSELTSDLIRMYVHIATSGRKGLKYILHDEFYKKHPTIKRVAPATLWERARNQYELQVLDRKEKLYVRSSWDAEHMDKLIQLYRKQPPNYRDQAQRLHEEWVRLHLEHEPEKLRSLQDKMQGIAREQAEEGEMKSLNDAQALINRRKWTRKNHADLLYIYHRIEKDKFEYARMLHEYWGKMNPELKYYKKENLRQRLRYLMKDHYEPTESEDEEARKKFNRLFISEDPRNHTGQPRKEDKGKKKMNFPAEEPVVMTSQLQDMHPLPFYDFMSVNEAYGGQHMASSSQAQNQNQNAGLQNMNYHLGESSTPSFQQHSDPALSPTTGNSSKQFFNPF